MVMTRKTVPVLIPVQGCQMFMSCYSLQMQLFNNTKFHSDNSQVAWRGGFLGVYLIFFPSFTPLLSHIFICSLEGPSDLLVGWLFCIRSRFFIKRTDFPASLTPISGSSSISHHTNTTLMMKGSHALASQRTSPFSAGKDQIQRWGSGRTRIVLEKVVMGCFDGYLNERIGWWVGIELSFFPTSGR